jgi:hypothetical protein
MSEDEIIKKHTKAVYEAWKDPAKDWKHKLKDVFLEVLIIVFAVTVSIWLHNWSEDIKDRRAEKDFLIGLKGDIQADLTEMKNDRHSLKKALDGVHYFEKIGGGMALNKDSLSAYIWIFFSQAQINPRISRFEALKGSGKLDIIENKKLQYDIIDLYQKNFPQIFRMNQFMNSLIADKFDSFIGDNMELDIKGSAVNAQEVLRKSKMRILLFEAEGFRNSVESYSQGMDKANEIIKLIDQELK